MADAGESHLEEELIARAGALRYLVVWAALAVLTAATYLLAKLPLRDPWHLVVALSIAVLKGSLVALVFMHLSHQRGANRLVFVTALAFVALLIGLTVADSATRFPLANPPNERNLQHEPPGGAPPRREPTPAQFP
jgi:cytochrome c oxidase subunit 4